MVAAENSSTLFSPLSLTHKFPDESNAMLSGVLMLKAVAFRLPLGDRVAVKLAKPRTLVSFS